MLGFSILFTDRADENGRYYEFRLPKVMEDEQRMDVFGVRFKVKGPQKDYTYADPSLSLKQSVCSYNQHRTDTAYERTFSADLATR